MTENEILKNAFGHLGQAGNIVLPPGHDCAAVETAGGLLLIGTADQLIEGIHYEKGTAPAKIARKLLARNLSDIAASGGAGRLFALCTVALGGEEDCGKWFGQFFRALGREASRWKVSVCGGDIARNARNGNTVLALSLFGETSRKKLCRRSGARPGDILFATGEFGNSFKSGHHLDFTPRLEEAEFLSGRYTNTMIDTSDGLLLDAGRIAEASGLGIRLDTAMIPFRKGATLESALGEGEDYELLFAVREERSRALTRNWPFRTSLTPVGSFAKIAKGSIISSDGEDLLAKFAKGYDHFGGGK